jgi:hypothetical protein
MSISFARTALVAAIVGIVATGCGAHRVKEVSGPPSVCEIRAEGLARATVIKTAYDHGQLGTAKQLLKWFHDVPRSAYLNADGTLRPLSQLRGDARFDFETWMNEHVANLENSVGDRVRKASDDVRRSSISTGKPCKQVILDQ